jgi:hypothetical protein
MPSYFAVAMAIAVSGSAWQNDVNAGFPDARASITLFRRGNSAMLFPFVRWQRAAAWARPAHACRNRLAAAGQDPVRTARRVCRRRSWHILGSARRGEEPDMSTAYMVAAGLVLAGLLLTAVGIASAARAINIDAETAAALAGIRLDRNRELEANLIAQSRAARRGLWTIFAGTVLQALGTAVPLHWT